MGPLILNIDTSLEVAIISISRGDNLLETVLGKEQKKHAALVHDSIRAMLQKHDLKITELNAVSVTAGPGSYTGLRVGLAAAKGLCYALKIPLIHIPTLELMVMNAVSFLNKVYDIYCPMIDARRLDVFAGLYNADGNIISQPLAMSLSSHTFERELSNNKIIFFGDGALKFQGLSQSSNANFEMITLQPITMALFAHKSYTLKKFANVMTVAPLYLKEFTSSVKVAN